MNDGVIKYSQTAHSQESLDDFDSYEVLEECRAALIEFGYIGVYPNGVGYGNISTREGFGKERGARAFVITGSQTGNLKRLAKSDYVRINTYNTNNLTMSSRGLRSASSESLTHAAIYDADEKIRAVIHIHDKNLWRFMLSGTFAKTSKEVEYGTKEMASAVGTLYESSYCPIFVTEGHEDGVFAVGSSMSEAMENLMSLR